MATALSGPPISPAYGISEPAQLVAADLDGDGHLDLLAEESSAYPTPTTQWLRGDGDGSFQAMATLTTSAGVLPGDFNGDGQTDLAVGNAEAVSLMLGIGGGSFEPADQVAATAHASPLIADVNGDGTEDVLVVEANGDILYRRGRPQTPGTFDPPIIVNPGFPSRNIAWVPVGDRGGILASVDARHDGVTLYALRDGGFTRIASLATGRLPAQVIAADLNGDGQDDLVVRNAGDGSLWVYFNGGSGPVWSRFSPSSPAEDATGRSRPVRRGGRGSLGTRRCPISSSPTS